MSVNKHLQAPNPKQASATTLVDAGRLRVRVSIGARSQQTIAHEHLLASFHLQQTADSKLESSDLSHCRLQRCRLLSIGPSANSSTAPSVFGRTAHHNQIVNSARNATDVDVNVFIAACAVNTANRCDVHCHFRLGSKLTLHF